MNYYRWEDDEIGGSILYFSPFHDEVELGILEYEGDHDYEFVPSMRETKDILSGRVVIVAETFEAAKRECIDTIRSDLYDEAKYYETLAEALDD